MFLWDELQPHLSSNSIRVVGKFIQNLISISFSYFSKIVRFWNLEIFEYIQCPFNFSILLTNYMVLYQENMLSFCSGPMAKSQGQLVAIVNFLLDITFGYKSFLSLNIFHFYMFARNLRISGGHYKCLVMQIFGSYTNMQYELLLN